MPVPGLSVCRDLGLAPGTNKSRAERHTTGAVTRTGCHGNLNKFKTLLKRLVIVATVVSVGLPGPATAYTAFDFQAPGMAGGHAMPGPADAPAPANDTNECDRHGANADCPSCFGIPSTESVASSGRPAEAAFEYGAHLEQAVLRHELPPPKHA